MNTESSSDMDTVIVTPEKNNEDTASIASSDVNQLDSKHADIIWFCQKIISRPVFVFGKYNSRRNVCWVYTAMCTIV